MYPRFARDRVQDALADTPAVLIHGPRQCGKTTLARAIGADLGHEYVTFDDDTVRRAADADPMGFVSRLPDRVILDEVQRVPQVFPALKFAIDRERTEGRFLLTGSANVLLVPTMTESLAGRMETVRLHPLAQCELRGVRSGFLAAAFHDGFAAVPRVERESLPELIVAGGFPPALARKSAPRRAAWYREYIDAIVQRDVRDLARVRSLDVLPRLIELLAGHTACLLNITELAGPFSVSRPTIREYVTLLERVFAVVETPAWHSSTMKRLIKAPKLHVADTGIVTSALGMGVPELADDRSRYGRILESFVANELMRMASFDDEPTRFSHWRDKDGYEVDVVLERGARLVGVEVKAAWTVRDSDFRGLRRLRDALGSRFACGIVLHDGEALVPFGDRLWAVPTSGLWNR
ncbi:MAG: ATP-binding protein [Coriobacteriia bacterium]|nr:ATP-binding protein [Coriobacteriia bacterium]